MKYTLLAALVALSLGNAAAQPSDPCETQSTTLEINACAERTLKAQDRELNDVYRSLLASLAPSDKDDPTAYAEAKKKLITAQRAWISYRDNDCGAKFSLHALGTIRTAVYLGCLAERTEQRIKELRTWSE